MLRRVPALLIMLILGPSGCFSAQRTIPVSKLGPPYRVEVYEGGKPAWERPIVSGSAEERAVTGWLKNHASGWWPDYVSHVPVQRIRSDGFDLNFIKERCVLNYRADSREGWVQVSRPIEDGDALPNLFVRKR